MDGIKGLDYYPTDTGYFDTDEIQLLEESHGESGVLRFLKLQDSIYDEGYFLRWDVTASRLFCKRKNYKYDDITAVIHKCCLLGLFHKEVFECYGVLTSAEIQYNFLRVANRRDVREIIYEYLVLSKVKWKECKLSNFTIVNLNKDPLDFDKLPSLNRPKKKVYTIPMLDLFSFPEEDPVTDRRRVIDDAIEDFTAGDKPEKPPVAPQEPVKILTPWEDAVRLASTPYSELSEEITKNISEGFFKSYSKIILSINEEYPELHGNTQPITPLKWKKLLTGPSFTAEQMYRGLHRLAGNGIKPDASMIIKLEQYIGYIVEEDNKERQLNGSKLNYKNPNNVQRIN